MKRSELLLKLQRAYYIRHVMVEHKHITPEQFMDEMLEIIEEAGMLPPTTWGFYNNSSYCDNNWESEDENL